MPRLMPAQIHAVLTRMKPEYLQKSIFYWFCLDCRSKQPKLHGTWWRMKVRVDFKSRQCVCLTCGYVPISDQVQLKLVRNMVYETDSRECVYCAATSRLSLDHVVPRSKGGSHTSDNLVTACIPCNAKKNVHAPPPMLYGRFRSATH